jgi:hypothetical protein
MFVGADEKQDLIKAITSSNLEEVKALIERNPDLINTNITHIGLDSDGFTDNITAQPLYFAAKEGNKQIVEFILSKGANVNTTAILMSNAPATVGGFSQIKKSKLSVVGEGLTPLHASSKLDVIELLVSKGANVNAIALSYGDQTTPLDFIVYDHFVDSNSNTEEYEKIVGLLLSRKAICKDKKLYMYILTGRVIDVSLKQRGEYIINLGTRDNLNFRDIVAIRRNGDKIAEGMILAIDKDCSIVTLKNNPTKNIIKGDTVNYLRSAGPVFIELTPAEKKEQQAFLREQREQYRKDYEMNERYSIERERNSIIREALNKQPTPQSTNPQPTQTIRIINENR